MDDNYLSLFKLKDSTFLQKECKPNLAALRNFRKPLDNKNNIKSFSAKTSNNGIVKDSKKIVDDDGNYNNIENKLTGSLYKEMESCEKSIAAENEIEAENINKQYEQNKTLIMEEQRHDRLMCLLQKSKFYTQFVMDRMKAQELQHVAFRKKCEEGKENINDTSEQGKRSMNSENSNVKKIKLDPSICEHSVQTDNIPRTNSSDNHDVEKVVPKLFENGTMRPYQVDGLYWLTAIYENGVNGILADEMGLGKTIQSIALICHLIEMGVSGPFLIIAPLTTLHNWLNEFARFSPKVPTLLYHGNYETRYSKRKYFQQKVYIDGFGLAVAPVVVTSYEVVVRDKKIMNKFSWSYIIVDEGHRLKNSKCKLTQCLGNFRSNNRLILTGTPLQNNLAELWSLLHFLLPEIFDCLDVFESWFNISEMMDKNTNAKIIQQEREKQIVSTLHQILNPFLLRRVKADVDMQIPAKKEVLVYTPMTACQRDLYKATLLKDMSMFKEKEAEVEHNEIGRPRRKCAEKIEYGFLFNKGDSDSAFDEYLRKMSLNSKERSVERPKTLKSHENNFKMQNIVMQLRRAVNHPYLLSYPLNEHGEYKIDEDLVNECGKLKVLDQILFKLQKDNHKVLLFSQMTKLLDILEDYMQLRPNFRYKRLDGTLSLSDRSSDIDEFNRDEGIFIYMLSTRAGSLGINLVAADTVIIYDSDWNPQHDLQAQDRCHRIGQTKPVLILRLCTQATIDEKIIERACTKRKLEKIILLSGKFKSGRLSERNSAVLNPEELLEMLEKCDHNKISDTATGKVLSEEELDAILDRSDITSKVD